MGALSCALLYFALAAPPGAIGPSSQPPPPPASAGWQPPVAPPGMGEAVGLAPPGFGHSAPGVSLLGAEALPEGEMGFLVGAGFPYLTAELLYGAFPTVAIYGRFDSLYVQLEQATLGARWTVLQTPSQDAIALRFEASQTFFSNSENGGGELTAPPGMVTPVWITGQRNQAIAAAALLSTRFDSGVTLFFDGAVQITVDDYPIASGPLGGAPPPFSLGLNTPLKLGAEVPVGGQVNVAFVGGMDVHFLAVTDRQGSVAMPFLLIALDGLL